MRSYIIYHMKVTDLERKTVRSLHEQIVDTIEARTRTEEKVTTTILYYAIAGTRTPGPTIRSTQYRDRSESTTIASSKSSPNPLAGTYKLECKKNKNIKTLQYRRDGRTRTKEKVMAYYAIAGIRTLGLGLIDRSTRCETVTIPLPSRPLNQVRYF
jgi:hypothetical protein